MSKLLDKKYEYIEKLCTQNCVDIPRSNRDPISLWRFLNDKDFDMQVTNINLKNINDSSYDFSVNIDISKDNEIVYSSVQKVQITIDKYKKIDNIYFQNLKNIFGIK